MTTQIDNGRAFRALHERDRAFIIPNPWDAGTARLLAHMGFEALAGNRVLNPEAHAVAFYKIIADEADLAGPKRR